MSFDTISGHILYLHFMNMVYSWPQICNNQATICNNQTWETGTIILIGRTCRVGKDRFRITCIRLRLQYLSKPSGHWQFTMHIQYWSITNKQYWCGMGEQLRIVCISHMTCLRLDYVYETHGSCGMGTISVKTDAVILTRREHILSRHHQN